MTASLTCLAFAGLISSTVFRWPMLIVLTFLIAIEAAILCTLFGHSGTTAVQFALAGSLLCQAGYGSGLAAQAFLPRGAGSAQG